MEELTKMCVLISNLLVINLVVTVIICVELISARFDIDKLETKLYTVHGEIKSVRDKINLIDSRNRR